MLIFLSLRETQDSGLLHLGPHLLSTGSSLVREWMLHPSVVAQIWTGFGSGGSVWLQGKHPLPPVLFVNGLQHTPGLDALAHLWPHTLLYVFLPVKMIYLVPERVHQQGLSILVALC